MTDDRRLGSGSIYRRWSGRKLAAREEARSGHDAGHGGKPAAQASDGAPPGPGNREPVPSLESLDENSDFSAFLTSDVDEDLRRQALRRLFHSAKFNSIDQLDVYVSDYTTFEPLGGIVTADMKHHLERLRQAAESVASGSSDRDTPAGDPVGDRGATDMAGTDSRQTGQEPESADGEGRDA